MIYRFHPAAETEHYETILFYQLHSVGLGADYLLEFERIMQLVVAAPQRYRIERQPNIRQASLTRFPYKVIYRELEGCVQILSVAHKRRRPSYWAGRI